MYVRASASAGGWGGGSPLVVHRGQDAEVAVGDRDASVLEPALLRPPRGPARRFFVVLLAAVRDQSGTIRVFQKNAFRHG